MEPEERHRCRKPGPGGRARDSSPFDASDHDDEQEPGVLRDHDHETILGIEEKGGAAMPIPQRVIKSVYTNKMRKIIEQKFLIIPRPPDPKRRPPQKEERVSFDAVTLDDHESTIRDVGLCRGGGGAENASLD